MLRHFTPSTKFKKLSLHHFSSSFSLTPSQFNSQLIFLIQSQNPSAALRLFQHMRSLSVPLDAFSFPPILAAASSLRLPSLGPPLHSLLLKYLSPLFSPFPFTSLLNLYSASDFPNDAVHLFDEMPLRDTVAWNSLISCFARCKRADDSIRSFKSMMKAGVPFTGSTLSSVITAIAESRDLARGMQVHAKAWVTGCVSVVLATTLVDFYARCGRMKDACNVFDGVGLEKDGAIYNAMLSGFVLNGMFEDAFLMLRRMEVNPVALSCVVNACSERLDLKCGKQMHGVMLRQGFEGDMILCNAVLGMYGKCGEIRLAKLVFERIREKSVVSWTSIIDAYGSHGLGSEALSLFRKMQEDESCVSPNSVTFLSILSACSHSGLVDEGRECLFLMKKKYHLEPSPEHYTCYIDLLGRAGKIEEAWDAFCSNDRVTTGVCVVMLSACRVGKDFARGEIVARRLLELNLENPGIYVLISNFYSDFGRWEGAEELRKEMRSRGMRKEVGSSLIAIPI